MRLFSPATIFLAKGLSRGKARQGTRRLSAILRLTTIGVALSLSVMLLSVTIILGFHRQVHEFAFSQTGHISLNGYGSDWQTSTTPIRISPRLLTYLRGQADIETATPLVQQAGLLKTEDDFSGILLYGIDSSFRSRYFEENIRSGSFPSFSTPSYQVGDHIRIYFFGEKMRIRVFELQAIYESTGLELSPALCPITTLQKLNHWDEHTFSRLLIMLREPERVLALQEKTVYCLDRFRKLGFEIGNTATPIVPLFIGDNEKTFRVTAMLFEEGVFVSPVVAPAVAPEDTLIRFSLMATHTYEQLDEAISKIHKVFQALDIPLEPRP